MQTQQYAIQGTRLLRLPTVTQISGKGKTAIYQGIKDGTFPAPVKLGARSVGWLSTDIDAWISSRVEATFGKEAA